ncbi:MAG: ATP-binding cassette domain-containing protein [Deltaproteobacteria bacterium]|nr:ATP-binding cassette domain-containing protein [Deltaproteobacteria bacterium]
MSFILRLNHISKSFGAVLALKDVSLDLGDNEILGLLGDNGAGKSTLVKIISGIFPPDSGSMCVNGETIDFRRYSGARSRRFGIETVHQDHALAEKQPLWRNVFVGRHLKNGLGFIHAAEEKRETLKLLHNVIGLPAEGLDPDLPASVLSGGERQGLAIGRAMYFQSHLIILDEPTTALSLHETEKVLGFIKKIKEAGKACIFISHNIAQVFAVADRCVVMDRGEIVADESKNEMTLESLTKLLISFNRRQEILHV